MAKKKNNAKKFEAENWKQCLGKHCKKEVDRARGNYFCQRCRSKNAETVASMSMREIKVLRTPDIPN